MIPPNLNDNYCTLPKQDQNWSELTVVGRAWLCPNPSLWTAVKQERFEEKNKALDHLRKEWYYVWLDEQVETQLDAHTSDAQ